MVTPRSVCMYSVITLLVLQPAWPLTIWTDVVVFLTRHSPRIWVVRSKQAPVLASDPPTGAFAGDFRSRAPLPASSRILSNQQAVAIDGIDMLISRLFMLLFSRPAGRYLLTLRRSPVLRIGPKKRHTTKFTVCAITIRLEHGAFTRRPVSHPGHQQVLTSRTWLLTAKCVRRTGWSEVISMLCGHQAP